MNLGRMKFFRRHFRMPQRLLLFPHDNLTAGLRDPIGLFLSNRSSNMSASLAPECNEVKE